MVKNILLSFFCTFRRLVDRVENIHIEYSGNIEFSASENTSTLPPSYATMTRQYIDFLKVPDSLVRVVQLCLH